MLWNKSYDGTKLISKFFVKENLGVPVARLNLYIDEKVRKKKRYL